MKKNRGLPLRRISPVDALRATLEGIVRVSSHLPHARQRRLLVDIVKDVPYQKSSSEEQRLDVIRAKGAEGVQPALLYIHGGGFAVCSKETHEIITHQYASMGFTVFSMDYRLMPEHPYPAGFHDACAALLWLQENAATYGADPERIIISGESAGANLSLGVTLASCYYDPSDAWAKRVFEAEPKIVALLPDCGVLQVTGMQRFWSTRWRDPMTRLILSSVQEHYLPPIGSYDRRLLWADPLLILERFPLDRPLPPTFAICGTADALLDDTRRLGERLTQLSPRHRYSIFPGELHAFHALVWRAGAQRAWGQKQRFLDEVLSSIEESSAASASAVG